MNILIISNLYPPHGIGGYETRCMQTVKALRQRGHTVHVLTSNHRAEQHDEAKDETGLYRTLRLHGVYDYPQLPIRELYQLEQANQTAMHSLLDELQPDLVHVWNMGGLGKSLLHTLERNKRPLVYDVSNYWIASGLKNDTWLAWWNESASALCRTLRCLARFTGMRKRIDTVVPTAPVRELKFKYIYFCSQYMRDTTVRQGYPVSHARIAYSGIEAAQFTQKSNYSPPRKFLWVGRLAPERDPMTALKGFLRAREACRENLTLDLYGHGDTDYVKSLQAEIEKNSANAYIRIKTVSHDEMRDLYAQYDAYIFSSNWGEPFALAPLEAMAAKLPVIMCPDGGDAELLHDGDNALKFSSGSPSSLAGAIARLMQLPDHGQKMSRIAGQLVEERYTLEVMVNKIEGILKRAAQST